MRTLLLINAVIEGLAGLLFLFYPGIGDWVPGWPDRLEGSMLMVVKMYGVAALTLGLLSGLLWRQAGRDAGPVIPGLLLFAFFHGGLAATQFLFNADYRPGILHAALALAFAYVFMKQKAKHP